MSPENFAYWLNGAFELGGLNNLNNDQVKIVKDHLALVLKKVTPQYGYGISISPPVVKGPTEVPSLQERFGITNTPFITQTATC